MISVCIATFNGAQFVVKQLQTVVKQLGETDQIIVVDDGSTDDTVDLIKKVFGERVELHKNEQNLGVIKSFEKAILLSKGDIIFLCDQDDIWENDKVEKVITAFQDQEVMLVTHDAIVVDGNDHVIHPSWNEFNQNKVYQGLFGNIWKNAYTGCMMAFRKEVIPEVIPFPANIEMHDQWIALVTIIKKKKIVSIEEPLMRYVRHGGNVTGMKKRPFRKKVKGRLATIYALIEYKLKKNNRNEISM